MDLFNSGSHSFGRRLRSWPVRCSAHCSHPSLKILATFIVHFRTFQPIDASLFSSCILVTFRGKKILFDCGVHPAHSGLTALPVFDEVDLREIDLCLVTHFHLDHCGAVPYLLRHTWFKGLVIMTEPTKAIAHLVWNDYAGFSRHSAEAGGGRSFLFSDEDVAESLDSIRTMHFGETLTHKGIEITCFGAGHVVGACMFGVKIGGINILYTGQTRSDK